LEAVVVVEVELLGELVEAVGINMMLNLQLHHKHTLL
jgi:hypothetical protein